MQFTSYNYSVSKVHNTKPSVKDENFYDKNPFTLFLSRGVILFYTHTSKLSENYEINQIN